MPKYDCNVYFSGYVIVSGVDAPNKYEATIAARKKIADQRLAGDTNFLNELSQTLDSWPAADIAEEAD